MSQPPQSERDPGETSGSDALKALVALGHELAGAAGSAQIVARAADTLRRAMAPDRVLVVLRDAGQGTPVVAYAHNMGTPRPDDPLIALVIQHGPRVLDRASPEWSGAVASASAMAAPIVGNSAIGAVALFSDTPGRYGIADLQCLTAVTMQMGLALEHAQLIDQLSRGKREWEQTVDAIPQAFCVVDNAGVVRRANRTFSALVKVPVTTVAGQPWVTLLPASWLDAVAKALARGGTGAPVEVHADKRVFTVTALPLGTPRDGAAALMFEDQTEKRRLQEQLVQSEKMSAIGQLIAGVAHDLNNPLTSVVGFADYLVDGNSRTPLPPALVEPLQAIRQEAERAASIVRNLLTFARKQEGQRHAQPVRPIVESTLALLKNQLMACKVEASLRVDPDLPDVDADANQLQQVFVNLINNAAQAIQASGTGGHILVHASRWLDGVAVKIQDDGPGIPGDIADKVFEPFFTTKGEGEGTGLGLSICQGIVKEHGGRITLATGAEGGATFRVELPGGSAHAPAAPRAGVVTSPLNILVVDDEPHILHYLQATLGAWGHRVTVCTDGRDALGRATTDGFDLVITDIRMPGLGGRELYEALARDHAAVARRVVFATGDTIRGDTLQFLEGLGRPFLKKPFSLADLRSILATATPAQQA